MKHADKWNEHRQILGRNVKQLREANKISLSRLAEAVGITRSHLHQLENSASIAPSVFVAYDLAVALGTSMEALMGLPVSPDDATHTIQVENRGLNNEIVTLKRKLQRIAAICKENPQ